MNRTCRCCGRSFRKGAAVMMCDRTNPKKLVGAIVCPTCAGTAVTILPALPVNKCKCGSDAGICHQCSALETDKARRGAADAKKLAKALRLRAKAYERTATKDDDTTAGIIVGLEQAADYLEKGNWT